MPTVVTPTPTSTRWSRTWLESSARRPRRLGLGLMYGMGKNKLAGQLDLSLDEASELIDTFHRNVPFLKGTVNAVMKRIEHPACRGRDPHLAR